MLSPIEKIKRFICLEIDRGFNNRSVVGGMGRYLPIWQREAPAEGIQGETIEKINTFLNEYGSLEIDGRQQAIKTLLQELDAADLYWKHMERRTSSEGQRERREPGAADPNRSADENRRVRRPLPNRQAGDAKEFSAEGQNESSYSSRRLNQQQQKSQQNDSLTLDSDVKGLPGVGIQNAKALAKQDVFTIRDFLYYFPRRYDDYSKFKTINKLIPGEVVTIIGVVYAVDSFTRGRYKITEARVGDGTGMIRISWFNQPWLQHQLKVGTSYVFSGKIEVFLGKPVMNSPEFEPADHENLNTNRIVPIYPMNANLKQNYVRRIAFNTVRYWADRVPEIVPQEALAACKLMPISKALSQIHFPDSDEMRAAAERRLAFDEVFLAQLSGLAQKRDWKAADAKYFRLSDEQMAHWVKGLPYQLTNAQWKVLNEIRGDIDSGKPMNRLIQGDVGAGKTIVACLASMIVANAGGQAVLMAPTSILAEQHYRTFQQVFEQAQSPESGLNFQADQIALLVGSTPEAEKRAITEKLADGGIRIVIGTHALLEDPVQFQDLELVIIDEQHRFGVDQRAVLRSKGTNPHLAVMTATPIPRSLALTVYGDLDLSVIDEKPVGRLPIQTRVVEPLGRERVYRHVLKEIRKGNQAFIIYPLVESGDDVQKEGQAAVEASVFLDEKVFPDQRVALLHGRMKGEEKDAILEAFKNREYDILVSTSVIEVGVDVPNATVMIIEGANRFGLAQLHQFRGRVGRGTEQAYCFLIPEHDAAVENERLQAMTRTDDGFKLAEIDLQQRGPGEFLGTRQSGHAMGFKIASMSDARLIEEARIEAEKIFSADPDLIQSEHAAIKERLTAMAAEKPIGDLS
jgi:ATP-dependent DNA helicase RecG